MPRTSLFVAVVLAALALGACKGDRNKCEQACRNYYTLVYWDKTDAEIAAAPEGARENLKKQRLAEFANRLEGGVEMCVNQCSSANNDEQIDCMMEAKTASAVEKCSAEDD